MKTMEKKGKYAHATRERISWHVLTSPLEVDVNYEEMAIQCQTLSFPASSTSHGAALQGSDPQVLMETLISLKVTYAQCRLYMSKLVC